MPFPQQVGQAAFAASHHLLLDALAERPGWAGGASQLIARLSGELAHAVGLPDADVDRIRTASLLHDLGKLGHQNQLALRGGRGERLPIDHIDAGVAHTVANATGVDPETARKNVLAKFGGLATGRMTTPEEVATLVVMLASPRTANVTGSNFVIDGGLIKTL